KRRPGAGAGEVGEQFLEARLGIGRVVEDRRDDALPAMALSRLIAAEQIGSVPVPLVAGSLLLCLRERGAEPARNLLARAPRTVAPADFFVDCRDRWIGEDERSHGVERHCPNPLRARQAELRGARGIETHEMLQRSSRRVTRASAARSIST